jgi:hypothetical protein
MQLIQSRAEKSGCSGAGAGNPEFAFSSTASAGPRDRRSGWDAGLRAVCRIHPARAYLYNVYM